MFELQVGQSQDLPADLVPDYEKNEEFLKKVHRVLLEVRVDEIFTRLRSVFPGSTSWCLFAAGA